MKKFGLFFGFKKEKSNSQEKAINQKKETTNSESSDYFETAKSWADDIYVATIASRNRYKTAFYGMTVLSILLAIAVSVLTPLQHTEIVVVHQPYNAVVWAEPARQPYTPANRHQIESEIVRYIVNRESYHQIAYNDQYDLVRLMSNGEVFKQYQTLQKQANSAPNVLGENGYKDVSVDNVVFLDIKDVATQEGDGKKHKNLAQVNFVITRVDKTTGEKMVVPLTALMVWEYLGTPANPSEKWRNWNGFTVTDYALQQRNI